MGEWGGAKPFEWKIFEVELKINTNILIKIWKFGAMRNSVHTLSENINLNAFTLWCTLSCQYLSNFMGGFFGEGGDQGILIIENISGWDWKHDWNEICFCIFLSYARHRAGPGEFLIFKLSIWRVQIHTGIYLVGRFEIFSTCVRKITRFHKILCDFTHAKTINIWKAGIIGK